MNVTRLKLWVRGKNHPFQSPPMFVRGKIVIFSGKICWNAATENLWKLSLKTKSIWYWLLTYFYNFNLNLNNFTYYYFFRKIRKWLIICGLQLMNKTWFFNQLWNVSKSIKHFYRQLRSKVFHSIEVKMNKNVN